MDASSSVPPRDESGALTVELGLIVVPVLGLIMMLALFGTALNFQISLSNGARDGVRVLALQGADPTSVALASAGVPGATVTSGRLSGAGGCTLPQDAGGSVDVFVAVRKELAWAAPQWLGGGTFGWSGANALTGRAVMRCGG